MISFRSLTGLISMMEIIVKISAIQQLTFSRFRDLLTVPGAVATGRLSESAFRWAPGRYRSRYCTTACTNVAWFDLDFHLIFEHPASDEGHRDPGQWVCRQKV